MEASMRKLAMKAKKSDARILRLRYAMLRKGGGLPPGSVRNWGGVDYVKEASGEWRRKVQGNKEPWDSSSEKAKELKISDFGTPEEVSEMAKMPRVANNRNEAVDMLRQISENGEMKSKSGLAATLSGKSIDEIVSGRAMQHSFNAAAHWQAAANVDKLFSNAIEPWKFELNPGKNNESLRERRYFYAPMEYSGRIVPVKLTVKEYRQIGTGKRLYSIEAIDADVRAK